MPPRSGRSASSPARSRPRPAAWCSRRTRGPSTRHSSALRDSAARASWPRSRSPRWPPATPAFGSSRSTRAIPGTGSSSCRSRSPRRWSCCRDSPRSRRRPPTRSGRARGSRSTSRSPPGSSSRSSRSTAAGSARSSTPRASRGPTASSGTDGTTAVALWPRAFTTCASSPARSAPRGPSSTCAEVEPPRRSESAAPGVSVYHRELPGGLTRGAAGSAAPPARARASRRAGRLGVSPRAPRRPDPRSRGIRGPAGRAVEKRVPRRSDFGDKYGAKWTAAGVGIAVAALLAAGLWAFVPAAPRPARPPALEVRGDRLLVDGSPAGIRGVFYNPWLSTPGPDGQVPSFRHDIVEQDLDDISNIGANAIELFEAPASVVVDAARHDLVTLYGFDIDWSDTSRAAFERGADAIVSSVRALGGHAGIAMWLLGRDVPARAVGALGRLEVEPRLTLLASRVKAIDPARPVAHASGPATAELELSGFDIACFDLAAPSEAGAPAPPDAGRYVREVIAPRAHGRPLLFAGLCSRGAGGEAEQASELAGVWGEIARLTAGGVIFEWADGAWTGPAHASGPA